MPTKGINEAWSSSRRSGVTQCKPLWDAATEDLFRNNAFRITGLAVDATPREISKHTDMLKLMEQLGEGERVHTAAFSLNPPPALDQIREATHKLKDPQKRIVDEFFWFWPQEFGSAQSDPALQAVSRGDSQAAFEIWSSNEDDPANGVVALHNLAIAHHVAALDWESFNSKCGVDPKRRSEILRYWNEAFKRWEQLVVDDRLWDRVTNRIRQLDDPSLKTSFARQMAATLPQALDKINAELAVAYAEKGEMELARLHVKFIRDPHRGLEDVDKTAELVLARAKARLRAHIQAAEDRAQTAPADAANALRELLDQAGRILPLFDLFFGKGHENRDEVFDEVAALCNRLQFAYYKETGDDQTCLELLQAILAIACSAELRKTIGDNFSVTYQNLAFKKVKPLRDALERIHQGQEVPTTKFKRFKREVAPQIDKMRSRQDIPPEILHQLFDSTAVFLRNLSVDIWNEQRNLPVAIAVIEMALSYVHSAEVRTKLTEDRNALLRIQTQSPLSSEADLLLRGEWFKAYALLVLCFKKCNPIFVILGIIMLFGLFARMVDSCNSGTTSTSTTTYSGTQYTPASSSPPTSPQITYSSPYSSVSAPASGYSPPTGYSAPVGSADSGSKRTHRVPSYVSSELSREKQAIENEKAKADAIESRLRISKQAIESRKAEADNLERQLETLGQQIEFQRPYVDRSSQFAVAEFNRKVNSYNDTLQARRAKNQEVNQMVPSHNALIEQARAQDQLVNQMIDNYNDKLRRYGR